MDLFFIYILKSSGALLLFFAIYKLFLQKETFFNANRSFLMIGLITSLIIPFIEFTKTVYIEAIPVTNVLFTASMTEVAIENKIDWLYITMIIYFLGVLFFSLRFIIQLLSLYKLINKGVLYKKYGFKFIETKENTSPFSFFNYIVYNPKKHTKEEIKTIIDHEKVHSSQNHSIDIIIAHLVSIFQWVNPIAWLYKKVIAQNLEYIADNHTTKKLDCTKNYQYLLLKQSSSNYNLSITNTFFNLLIKKRIVMLNKNKSQKQNAWKYGIIIPLLVGFIISFNVKTNAQTIEVEENKDLLTENVVVEFNLNNNNTTDNELKELTKEINNEIHNEYSIRFEGNPIYIVNEKKVSKEKFNELELNHKNSEPPHILIGEDAIEKYGEEGKNGVFEITTKNKIKYSVHHKDHIEIYANDDDPLYILNGKKISAKEFAKLSLTPNKIVTMHVLKGKKAIKKYGEEGKNGVVEITTEIKINESIEKAVHGKNPLYILDGKKISTKEFKKLNLTPEKIEKVEVLKGDKAIKKYGDDAKDGVVEITPKK